MGINYKQLYAIKEKNKKRILKCNTLVPERSGIYILTRCEDNFKYAYIGQAKNILRRLADHLNGYQHIDLSLKKHGLYSDENKIGWRIDFELFNIEELDQKEQEFIIQYANKGYQMRNKTVGGQGAGKKDLGDKLVKGYQNGLHNGYNKARKEFAELLAKVEYAFAEKINKNGTQNANSVKALQKIKEFIKVE